MKSGWQSTSFEECIEKVTYTPKVQRKDFLGDGTYPIVSQEDDFINGYWDNEADLFKVTTPIVVFGDHTKILKYVDFNFVLGADGVKILRPREFLLPKFFFYQLQRANLDSLGYARHYRLLKELEISYPDRPEQQRIVGILDEAFEGIATAKANAEKNLQNARALFESHLQSVFTQRGEGWPIKKLGELSNQITDGTHNSPPYVEAGIPMLDSKHVKDGFLIDDTEPEKFISPATDALLAKRCKPRTGDILVSSRGTIGKIAIVREGQDFNIMGNMILIRLPAGVSREFAAFYLHSQVSHMESIARGVAQKGLYLNQIRDYELPLPPETKRAEIGKQLDALSGETQRLASLYERKLAALDALKKSLLHRAFSGHL